MFAIQGGTLSHPKYGKRYRMGTILVVDGKVMLIYRRLKNRTIRINGPPGGGLDEHGTPEQSIVRGVNEEVGLDVKIRAMGDELV